MHFCWFAGDKWSIQWMDSSIVKSRIDDYRIYRILIYRFQILKCPPLLFSYKEFNIDGEIKTTKDDRIIAFFLPLRGNPACNLTIKIISCVSIEWRSSGHRTTTGSFIAGCVSTICKVVDLFLCALSEKFPAWDWESLRYLLLLTVLVLVPSKTCTTIFLTGCEAFITSLKYNNIYFTLKYILYISQLILMNS